jgi:hypothetical protein
MYVAILQLTQISLVSCLAWLEALLTELGFKQRAPNWWWGMLIAAVVSRALSALSTEYICI